MSQAGQIRDRLGVKSHKWFGRQGFLIEDLPEVLYEFARINKQMFKARKADHYAMIFQRAAIDLADTAITYRAANRLLGRPTKPRPHLYNVGNEPYGRHPLMEVHRNLFNSTFADRDEVRRLYNAEHQ